MPIPDLSGLSDNDLKELQKKAGDEQFKRAQQNQIFNAANDLITQAKFQGYNKAQVKAYLSNLIDEIYA